jgi:hypothetical protein
MIYFMKPADRENIKIGYSKNVRRRQRQLSKHWGCKYHLLRVIPGGRETEREIYELLSHLRVGKSEFFRLDTSLYEFLVDTDEDLASLRVRIVIMEVQNYLNRMSERYEWEDNSWEVRALGEILKRLGQQMNPDPKQEAPSNRAAQEHPLAAAAEEVK